VRTTEHFERKIRDRGIRREWCEWVVSHPLAIEVQEDARIPALGVGGRGGALHSRRDRAGWHVRQRVFRPHVREAEDSMRYFYDRESDSLYLSLTERAKYKDSVEAAPGVVLDFDSTGRLMGIDLEHASKTIDTTDLALHEQPARHDAAAAKVDGARLKRERQALGLTQAQLARALSVSANTVARWERGELKIEHPGMIDLAIEALHRRGKQKQKLAGYVARAAARKRR
jgi:DNA-binding transcriptional regulator YiaG